MSSSSSSSSANGPLSVVAPCVNLHTMLLTAVGTEGEKLREGDAGGREMLERVPGGGPAPLPPAAGAGARASE